MIKKLDVGNVEDHKAAHAWLQEANKTQNSMFEWDWGADFKLSYTGPIISFESVFYPPQTNGRRLWQGYMRLHVNDTPAFFTKYVEHNTLEELQQDVERTSQEWLQWCMWKINQ